MILINFIDKDTKAKIYEFIKQFIKKLKDNYNDNMILESEMILYISEIIGTEFEDQELIKICNDLIKKNLKNIEDSTLGSMGMISELGVFCFAINTINIKTKELQKLLDKLNTLLLDVMIERLKKIINSKNVMNNYDCVSGVSGVLYYLLNNNINDKTISRIKLLKLKDYLVWLTYEKEDNAKILNFQIDKDNLFLEEEKVAFKDGMINFSLSHGIMGPMMALNRYYQRYPEEDLKERLNFLYNIYKKFQLKVDDYIFFPSKLDIKDFIDGFTNNYLTNYSWCYGDISLLIGMVKVSRDLNILEDYLEYMRVLTNIFDKDISFYNFNSPILCHGYASVVMEQVACFRNFNNGRILRTLNRNVVTLLENFTKINKVYLRNKEKIFQNGILRKEIQGHQDDLSFLNGSGGVFLVLLDLITNNGFYGKLLMM